MRAALGEKLLRHKAKSEVPYVTYMVSSKRHGVLKSVSFSEKIKPFVDAYIPDKQPGDEVEPFINADKRVGALMLRFDRIETRNEIAANIEDHIFVEVE